MLEHIKSYQLEYIKIIKDFQTQDRKYDEYMLLVDKIEILLKKNKKVILNFLSLNTNYVYYGGATYFSKDSKEILPINFSQKKVIVADPLIKLQIFLKNNEMFKFNRVKEIINNSINNTLKLEKELEECSIIYINPFDFIASLKNDIFDTAQMLTMNYFNHNVGAKYNNLVDLINDNNKYSFDELNQKYPKLNQFFVTVNSNIDSTLQQKIEQNYIDCGIDKNKFEDISPIEEIVNAFVGLFGQAFELKTISLILGAPLYITRPNVLIYLSCISTIDKDDEQRTKETNILFALYQSLKKLSKENIEKINSIVTDEYYKKLTDILISKKISIDSYIKDIEKFIKGNKIINK